MSQDQPFNQSVPKPGRFGLPPIPVGSKDHHATRVQNELHGFVMPLEADDVRPDELPEFLQGEGQ